MPILPLDPLRDRAAILGLLIEASDYYRLWLGRDPVEADVEEMLTQGPPGCDPATSHRLGLWGAGLEGVAELSFGFPTAKDAYLGLMILAPRVRSMGQGAAFLQHVEALARAQSCPRLYLGVLEANPRGRAFWDRHGFRPTGVSRQDDETGHRVHRLGKDL